MRRMPILAALLVMAGCGPTRMLQFTGTGVPPEQLERDRRECLYDAQRTAAGRTPYDIFSAQWERQDTEGRVWNACMRARGYQAR